MTSTLIAGGRGLLPPARIVLAAACLLAAASAGAATMPRDGARAEAREWRSLSVPIRRPVATAGPETWVPRVSAPCAAGVAARLFCDIAPEPSNAAKPGGEAAPPASVSRREGVLFALGVLSLFWTSVLRRPGWRR